MRVLSKASRPLLRNAATHERRNFPQTAFAAGMPTSTTTAFQGMGNSAITQSSRGFHHSTSTSLRIAAPDWLPPQLAQAPASLAVTFASILSIVAAGAYWKYRGLILNRLRLLREESWLFGAGVTMERVKDGKGMGEKSALFSNLKLLELNPDFKKDCQEQGWNIYSLGEYMGSLRPKQLPKNFDMDKLPNLIQREIEAGLAAGLMTALGPNLGRALLPITSLGPIEKRAQSLAASIATNWFLSPESGSMIESGDKGGIPVSLMTLLAASDFNARLNSGKDVTAPTGFSNMDLSPIQKMKAGEVVKGPTFATGNEKDVVMPAKNFVIERDFDETVKRMEIQLARAHDASGQTDLGTQLAQAEIQNGGHKVNGDEDVMNVYDPDDRRLPDPVPVNPRLFPGLHVGYGKAICSHTKREVLKMRLFAVLLNRLGSNYYKHVHGETDELFSVQMQPGGKVITKPWELVQALIESGHNVEVVPTTHLTTFGVNLCVKEEDDDSWSNIPLGVFLESGYQDQQGRMAPAMMPHSGLDMYISGPLVGKRADGTPSKLRIQHFAGIEGFCGWNSNELPDVPFNTDVETGPRLVGTDAVRAARVAALYANVLNGLATELKLPFGGYGVTAVCNDSAALVQQCLYQESTIYPMTSVGRFLLRSKRYAEKLAKDLRQIPGMDEEVEELMTITHAMKKIPSDINASPSNAKSAAKRMLQTLPPSMPFRLMKDSKHVMESILVEEEQTEAMVAKHIGMRR